MTIHLSPCRRNALVVFTLALILRLMLLGLWGPQTRADSPGYTQPARNLLAGHGYSADTAPPYRPTMLRTPGYPMFLAAIYALTGGSDAAVVVLQAILSALTCALAVAVGARWFSLRAATVAGVLLALDPLSWYYALMLMTETWTMFLLALLLWCLCRSATRRTLPWAIASGVLGGWLTLTRPAMALAWVLPAAFWAWPRPGVQHRHRLVISTLLAAGLVIAPWVIRNTVTGGYAGLTPFSGHALLWRVRHEAIQLPPEHLSPIEHAIVGLLAQNYFPFLGAGKTHPDLAWSEVEINQACRELAVRIIARDPVSWLRSCARELAHILLSMTTWLDILADSGWLPAHPWGGVQGIQLAAEYPWVVWVQRPLQLGMFLAFCVCAPLGVRTAAQRLWAAPVSLAPEVLCATAAILYVILVPALLVDCWDRMRLPAEPWLWVFATGGVEYVWNRRGAKDAEKNDPKART